MKNVLIFGAGRSASVLIDYLLKEAVEHDWHLTLAEQDVAMVEEKLGGNPRGTAVAFNIHDAAKKRELIAQSDIVISMLPARFHILLVEDCLALKKSLVTASYQSSLLKVDKDSHQHEEEQREADWQRLDKAAKAAGILLISEMGLDPGIDHMSAQQMIDQIKSDGGDLVSFKSFTGGLVAPGYDNNPWQYKFTWNPRNVVLAGQGVAQYIRNGRYKYIPYHQLFNRLETVEVPGYGAFDGYPNRDSLSYRSIYGIDEIPTIFRGTLRRPGYCESWSLLVQLGMTDDSYKLEDSENMTYRDFTNTFLVYHQHASVEDKFCRYLGIDKDTEAFHRLQWLGLFEAKPIGLANATPAQILQHLLEEKWALGEEDKDMIVMQHQFEYHQAGDLKRRNASLVVIGDDDVNTAMAKTVGLPVGIITKLLLTGQISQTGMHIPVDPTIYNPVLQELKHHGIEFVEEELTVSIS